MNTNQIETVLQLQIDWVRAADSKIPPLFAIDVAMLGVTIAMVKTLTVWTTPIIIFTSASALLLLLSVLFLSFSIFPKTDGPKDSNIYFGGISQKREESYIKTIEILTEDALRKDLISQTHRNAEIARQKFCHIKTSFILSFVSLPFWLTSIYFLYD